MIRVALYLILVGAIAYGVALLADRPGGVVITWQGLRLETSLMVLGAMGISVPLFIVAAIFTGLAGVIVVCAALAVIAIVSSR